MANVSFLDTSILLNLLDVPQKNQSRDRIVNELKELLAHQETLILPLATMIETGNHIAHIRDGNIRRTIARKMAVYLQKTADGEAPWVYYGKEMGKEDLCKMAQAFPDAAMREMGLGDLSIIRAYEKYKQDTPGIGRLRIWSIDQHLGSYCENMVSLRRR